MVILPDIDILHELADAADVQTMARFRTNAPIAKGLGERSFDPVTEADRDAEAAMRQIINLRFPEHVILGEEFGAQGESRWKWVLDPIDGTRPFICGIPSWGTLIGFMDHDVAQRGMLSQPFNQERFWATLSGA